jgi:hypothetical protein
MTAPPKAKKKFKGDILGSIINERPYTMYRLSQCETGLLVMKKIRSVGMPYKMLIQNIFDKKESNDIK